MTRLLVHVEGQTEETFVDEVLAPELYRHGYLEVNARIIGNARQRHHRGGVRPWPATQKDIVNHLKEDANCIATTMFDYYGLPDDWPGRLQANTVAFPQKADTVQDALLTDVRHQMGHSFDPTRFIPYVMMHEFEAMLFSDCERFSVGIGRPELSPSFQQIRDGFASPEDIDDSPSTAPSKRIQKLIPGYQKPLLGNLASLEIGIDVIRAECAHFREWLETLERLPGLAP